MSEKCMHQRVLFSCLVHFEVALLLIMADIAGAAVTGLSAASHKGKVYITFTEETGSGLTYSIYRSNSPIASVNGLTPLVVVKQKSGYDSLCGRMHTITDLGPALVSGTGLFVYTPHTDGNWYYAVTVSRSGVEDTSITVGTNSLSTPLAEHYQKWPGAIMLTKDEPSGMRNIYKFYYWMDYFDWNHASFYYGALFVLIVAADVKNTPPIPLSVYLHGAGGDPADCENLGTPVLNGQATLGLRDNHHPLGKQTWWYGYSNNYGNHPLQAGDTIVGYTEMRIINYLEAIVHDPNFTIDTNRIYIQGSSMGGSGSLHVALHHPEIFAAFHGHLPLIDYSNWEIGSTFYGPPSMGLTARNGVNIYNWMNGAWLIRHQTGDMPFSIISHGSLDGGMPMYQEAVYYDSCQTSHQGLAGQWYNMGHDETHWNDSIINGSMLRFRKNELYPAFSNASRNDNYGTEASSSAHDSVGIMNSYIDWTSSLHEMGLPNDSLADSPDSIGITLRTARSPTVTDVSLRRVQRFPLVSGVSYNWTATPLLAPLQKQHGACSLVGGCLTIPRITIDSGGVRLSITAPASAAVEYSLGRTAPPLAVQILGAGPKGVMLLRFPGKGDYFLRIYTVSGKLVRTCEGTTSGGVLRLQPMAGAFPEYANGAYFVRLSFAGASFGKQFVVVE